MRDRVRLPGEELPRTCARAERRLAAGATPEDGSRLAAHLAACRRCAASAAAYQALRTTLAAYAAAAEREAGLPSLRRARIVAAAAGGAARRRPLPAALPSFSWAAAASLVLLVVGGGYLWNFVPVQGLSDLSVQEAAGGVQVQARHEGDGVVLEWQNGHDRAYMVRQATSAREVREAPGQVVQGHRFVDRSPSDAQMVYYLVE
jgi:hypothetical protein